VLFAISREESAFLPKALSVADARGLMQVIPPTGSGLARRLGIKWKADTLFDPSANTRIGARYLAGLRTQFSTALPLAFAGYNAGPGAPKKWLEERPGWDFDLWVENIPYTETRNYVKRVLSSVFAYQVLYGETHGETQLGEIANCPLAVPR
jgi:soluble lytic murein transglycosylase